MKMNAVSIKEAPTSFIIVICYSKFVKTKQTNILNMYLFSLNKGMIDAKNVRVCVFLSYFKHSCMWKKQSLCVQKQIFYLFLHLEKKQNFAYL